MPPGHERQIKAAPLVLCCQACHRLPWAAVIAGGHLHRTAALGIQPQRQSGKIPVLGPVQPNVTSGQLKVQLFLHTVGGLPVRFAAGICGPQCLPVPKIKLSAGAGHLVGAHVFFAPERALGIVHQQPCRIFACRRAGHMQVIAAIQRTAHRALHIGQPARIQRAGHFCWNAAVPCHHTVRRKIIERLVQHTQAARRVFGNAPAAQRGELKIRRLGAIELVQCVLLKEQRIAHACGRAGKRTIAAHRHCVAVCRNAPVGKPVGGVA